MIKNDDAVDTVTAKLEQFLRDFRV